MAADEIHLNDIGTIFRCTIKDSDGSIVDLSTATTLQLLFRKPSGELLTKTATAYTDGADGIIQYSTVDGDLDEIGTWKFQGYIVINSNSWHSDVESFKVHRNV